MEGKWLPEALQRSSAAVAAQAEEPESEDNDIAPWEEDMSEAA